MKTMEQLGEELCKYCEYSCGGDNYANKCDTAYENYIIENNLENELILEDNKNGKQ